MTPSDLAAQLVRDWRDRIRGAVRPSELQLLEAAIASALTARDAPLRAPAATWRELADKLFFHDDVRKAVLECAAELEAILGADTA